MCKKGKPEQNNQNKDPAQKVLISNHQKHTSKLEKELNELGQAGYRMENNSTMVIHGGSGFTVGGPGYWFEANVFVFNKSDRKYTYKCTIHKRGSTPTADMELINPEIQAQNEDGFTLRKVLPLSMISDDEQRPSKGTFAFILIFEKSI